MVNLKLEWMSRDLSEKVTGAHKPGCDADRETKEKQTPHSVAEVGQNVD
jgi:hypothetical protein